jgi:CubicO group peptidase (beta-lactamase class C family)
MSEVEAAKVDSLFAEWDREDSPGCALGVIQGGELIYARGYGSANLDLGVPLSPRSVLHVASVSKEFTAIATGILDRQGKLSLDDDIRKYVPEMPDLGHTITLRQLIHHTSGLRDQYGLFRLAGWRDEDVQTFDDVLDFAYRHRRLNFDPGAEYTYCNTSYTLLALTIERVSGQKYRDFVREQIFEPLGMTQSHFHDDVTEIVPNRASGYGKRDEGGFRVEDSNVSAVGAICLYTCVEDLAKWVRNFQTREVAGDVLDDAFTAGPLNDGTTQNYGFGLQIGKYRGLKTISHGGVDSGYRAELLWFPEVDFGVVILANLSEFKPGWMARKVADLYLGEKLSGDDLLDAPAIDLPEADLAALSGLYRDERRSLTRRVELRDGKLFVSIFEESLELVPFGNGRFRLGTPPAEIQIRPNDDGTLEYHEIMAGEKRHTYVRVEPVTPDVEALASYAGSYYCPELGARYSLLVRDGALIRRLRKAKDRELKPTVEDSFGVGSLDVVFTRDSRGDVNGFEIFTERIRYLRFDRM